VGDGSPAVPVTRGGGGAWGQRDGRAARRGRQRPGRDAHGQRTRDQQQNMRGGADRWAPATVLCDDGLNTIQIQMNSNYFKTFQTLTGPKSALPSPKN
jgi:hypothetical protein